MQVDVENASSAKISLKPLYVCSVYGVVVCGVKRQSKIICKSWRENRSKSVIKQ